MRTVMLRVGNYINKESTCVLVELYRGLGVISFIGFSKEETCREVKDEFSVGMWKIKKLK